MARRWAPYAFLLAQVLLFFRAVLFTSTWLIPFDLPGYHLPLATYAAQSLGEGRFPMWDNFTYCGFPFYANVQAQLLYPPAWPFFALGNVFGLDRMLDLLEWQVALHVWLGGALAYRLLREQGAKMPAALLGATAFQLGGFFASQAQHLGVVCAAAWLPLVWSAGLVGSAPRFAFGLAMTYLAGYPAAAVVAGVTGAMIAPWRTVAIGAPLAAGLAMMQLGPATELAAWSSAPLRGSFTGDGGGVPLQAFISMVWPNYHHVFDAAEYTLPRNRSYLYLYCGLLPLAAAIAGLLRSPAPRWLRVMAPLSLLWMLGETTPLWRWGYALLPVALKSVLMPELAMMAFLLALSLAAAMGVRDLPAKWLWAAVLLAWADLTMAGSSRSLNTALRSDTPLALPNEFEGSQDTLRIARELTGRAQPPWRIDIANDSMNWANAAPVIRIATATGNDPLCLARIKDVRLMFAQGDRWMHYYTVDKPDSPILDLLNVRYLLAWPQPGEVAALPGHQLRENPDALPRFFVVGETRAGALKDLDPRRFAIVEGAAPMNTGAAGSVEVEEYGSRRLRLRVTADREAFLVSSETYYPGWHAEIDGKPAPLVLTNHAFRGLAIPGGTHTVAMKFTPGILWLSLAASAVSWIALALLAKRSIS